MVLGSEHLNLAVYAQYSCPLKPEESDRGLIEESPARTRAVRSKGGSRWGLVTIPGGPRGLWVVPLYSRRALALRVSDLERSAGRQGSQKA